MGDVDPSFLVSLNLLSEELISGQVEVGQVVLDLLLDNSHVLGGLYHS